ncbi:MAG: GNAT family N-acetyltransferase [Nitrospiraceae bacterium]|nr:GNAT family N-acetyltransferase [Nitrospiraceae bacterium]
MSTEFKKVRDEDCAAVRELLFAHNPGAVIQGRYYMAVEDGVIKGIVGLLWRSWYLSELRHLYVKPEFRRTGIGAFLVEKALERVKTPLACCTVREDNEGSLTLFRCEGFIVERRFANPETGNTVALMMRSTEF